MTGSVIIGRREEGLESSTGLPESSELPEATQDGFVDQTGSPAAFAKARSRNTETSANANELKHKSPRKATPKRHD